ncbi:PepSY-associated TM helix domain-containing protein [Urbifossiella limnaea]|uniref:Peptidase n=1 Tax=Urbifossiella limnaea TaxID=2528023 RepID=A0A517XP19_9BACT|nr:PepSY-associated TM helix domain-containing protein [Urbifossiella limnaea]QDU19261.1 hypothetical protein ETAA1_11670 [Urbifossiella limnaea]
MSPAYRRLLKVARAAHLYLTLAGLALILFFSVTGFMLNHEAWFLPDEPTTRTAEGTVPEATNPSADRLDVSEGVRRAFGARGEVKSYRADEETVEVEYLRPGERTLAEVRRSDGRATVTVESRGWAAVAVDLHKGKYSGRPWMLLIDVVCVLMLVISATGLVLWWSLKSRGKWGALLLLLGGAAGVAVYAWLVP